MKIHIVILEGRLRSDSIACSNILRAARAMRLAKHLGLSARIKVASIHREMKPERKLVTGATLFIKEGQKKLSAGDLFKLMERHKADPEALSKVLATATAQGLL